MSETPTPRTDAIESLMRAAIHEINHERGIALREGAICGVEQLETELADARAELAALRAEQATPQWLPIESAPRDGTRIVTAEESDKGFWFQEDWWIEDEIEWQYATDPIGWMPLPAAPPRDLREGES